MWRLVILPTLAFSLQADSPLPNMGEVGKAAHGLSDEQTAMYFMVVVLIALLIERGLTGWRNNATFNRIATSVDKMREVISNGDAQAMANMAVIQHELVEARRDRENIKAALKKRQSETRE